MPPSPCSGSTNTDAVRPFWIAARADSKSSYFASLPSQSMWRRGQFDRPYRIRKSDGTVRLWEHSKPRNARSKTHLLRSCSFR